MSVKINDAVSAPGGAILGVNTSEIVQESPWTTCVFVVRFDAPHTADVIEKSAAFAPVIIGAPENIRVPDPVFVSVSAIGALGEFCS